MPKLVRRAGGLLLKDKKVLLERSKDKSFFIPPGGRVEDDETMQQAVVRELFEELKIVVKEKDLEEFTQHFKPAGGQETYDVEMTIFLIKTWTGEIVPDNEVEELLWFDSKTQENIVIGSIFRSEVLPKLLALHLIN